MLLSASIQIRQHITVENSDSGLAGGFHSATLATFARSLRFRSTQSPPRSIRRFVEPPAAPCVYLTVFVKWPLRVADRRGGNSANRFMKTEYFTTTEGIWYGRKLLKNRQLHGIRDAPGRGGGEAVPRTFPGGEFFRNYLIFRTIFPHTCPPLLRSWASAAFSRGNSSYAAGFTAPDSMSAAIRRNCSPFGDTKTKW